MCFATLEPYFILESIKMSENKFFTINARKFDGKIHRTWQAEVIEETNILISFRGIFAEEIKHSKLGVIRRGTVSYEFYWLKRCYNVFRFHEPNGKLRNFYCNINLPPTFENNILDYIDLDLDVLVWQDFNFQILDLDEFEQNARKFSYPDSIRRKAKKNLAELVYLIENRKFPFDYQTQI